MIVGLSFLLTVELSFQLFKTMKLNKKECIFLAWLISGLVIYGRMEQAAHEDEIEWKRNLENLENEKRTSTF